MWSTQGLSHPSRHSTSIPESGHLPMPTHASPQAAGDRPRLDSVKGTDQSLGRLQILSVASSGHSPDLVCTSSQRGHLSASATEFRSRGESRFLSRSWSRPGTSAAPSVLYPAPAKPESVGQERSRHQPRPAPAALGQPPGPGPVPGLLLSSARGPRAQRAPMVSRLLLLPPCGSCLPTVTQPMPR